MPIKIINNSFKFSLLLLGFGMSASVIAADKIPVVASFSVLGDLVSEVGGDHITLTTLVKANGDAHVYNPTPKDVQSITHAKLLVMNGLSFEGWMPRLLESAAFKGETVVAANGIDVIENEEHEEHEHHEAGHEEHHDEDHHDDHEAGEHSEHHHGAFDPHAWHSISNAKVYVQNIEKGLSHIDPKNSNEYKANAANYIKKLDKLADSLHAKIDNIPVSQRKVLTAHDAFSYLARDFNISFIAPQGTSTEAEASAADVASIIKQIRHDKVQAVFMESIADNRMIEQISRETDSKMGGKLFSDALSADDEPASTYIKMMEYNVSTIVEGLSR
jgi:zinc/manganese transport system substrate-binding protein